VANALYYGDNLDVLRRYVKDESVDLVYLDPPFNSNANYSVLFGHADGTQSAAQIQAFEDTWRWDEAAAATFQETVTAGGDVASALAAFQKLLGPSTMLAYLSMMAPRLVELRRVLRRTGSLYLHCDPTATSAKARSSMAGTPIRCCSTPDPMRTRTTSSSPDTQTHTRPPRTGTSSLSPVDGIALSA
jgi:DNA modification methylase